MNALIKKLLERRGITPEMLAAYEDPSHGLLENVDKLAARLHELKEDDAKIVIFPDYDMDGIMSGIVGYAGLSELGFDVELFIPDPRDGYGFKEKQVDLILSSYPDACALLSCDCGISCKEGTAYASARGLDVLITDHHMEAAETSVRDVADIVVDPCSLTDNYEHPAICGAHVLWQCLDFYASKYGTEKERERIWWLRFFAGVGTVSDVMPVLYENRLLVRDAIDICRRVWECTSDFMAVIDGASEPYKQAFRGIYTVCKTFSEKGKLSEPSLIDEQFFGFYLAPTFNSAKRMDGEMSRAYGVFKDRNAKDDMSYLFSLNEKRKRLVTQKFAEMRVQDNPLAPYCYVVDAPAGILGLLAMKALSLNQVPCVVVASASDGTLYGSGRSPEWYPFLTRASFDFYSAAGHEGAFGCGFPNMEALEELHSMLAEDVPHVIAETPSIGEPQADLVIADDGSGDIGVLPHDLMEFVEELSTLKPFGRGMEEPQLMVRFDAERARWSIIGQQKNHLKISLDGGLDVLCWNQADFMDAGKPTGTIIVVGKLSINEFEGRRAPQFSGDIILK